MPKKKNGFSFISKDEKEVFTLTIREKAFCDAYLEMRGSGMDAIFTAGYKPKSKGIAAAMAYEMLKKPDIISYINLRLEEYGFNEDNVMRQHLFLLNQHANFMAKKDAIDMFYKLRGKYAASKIKFQDDNNDLDDDELEDEIARLSTQKPTHPKKEKSTPILPPKR